MSIEVSNESEVSIELDIFRSLAAFVLDQMKIHPAVDLGISFVDEKPMADLHIRWLDEEGPTDVLSFPMDELRPGSDLLPAPEGILGDVVICPQVAIRQAEAAGHTAQDEMLLLLTHGMLHLMGYDHAEPEEEREMFGLQQQLCPSLRRPALLEALIAVPFLAVTLFLATIQTHLEIEEDPRAGSLSIARALLLVMLGSLWLLMPQLGIWQAVLPALLFAVWFAQQLGGRLLGRMRLAAGLATKAEVVVASIARVFHPLRLKAPEQLEEYEQELIESVEDFSETLVREVMVPRVDLEVVEHDSKLESALSTFIASGYSRLPVVGEDVDDIRGILYLKDVAKLFHQNPALLSEKSAEEVSRKALFVPDTKVVSELMRQMQESRVHVAVVSDEYGGIAGLVTIEDLIEELVGDISDEYDRELGGIEDLGEGSFRVSPRVTLDELSEHCDMELEDEDVDTVGGLLTKAVGALPSGGEVVSALGLELTAERVDARRGRILSIRVRKL